MISPYYNITKSLHVVLNYLAVMPPAVSQFPHQMENKGGDANDRSTIVVMGFVIILVALYLAALSYCQLRWRNDDDPTHSLSPSPFIQACRLSTPPPHH